MNDLQTAAQQALEAICSAKLCEFNSMSSRREMVRLMDEAITALRAALAQQAEPVEPVAKVELMMTGGNAGLATRIVEIDDHLRERLRPGQLLYTAPPQRKPLTDQEIDRIRADCVLTPHEYRDRAYGWALHFARAVECAHGIGGQE